MTGYGAHDELTDGRVHWTLTNIVEVGGTEVGRHDDDGILEVHDAALAVGETTVVEHLEEQRHELPAGLLDLVDEDDRVGLAADVFSELPSGIVTDVARRSTDETRD